MKLRLRFTDQKTEVLSGIAPDLKIKELKRQIITQVPEVYVAEAVHLVYQGVYLTNLESPISKYNLVDDSLLAVIVNPAKNIKSYQPISVSAPNNIYQLVNQMIQSIPTESGNIPSQLSFTHRVSPELQQDVNNSSTDNAGSETPTLPADDTLTSVDPSDSTTNTVTNLNNQTSDNLTVPQLNLSGMTELNLTDDPSTNNETTTTTTTTPDNTEPPPTLNSVTEQYISSLEGLINQLSNITTTEQSLETTVSTTRRDFNLASLESMGYTDRQLNILALDSCHGSVNLAIDWLENLR